MGGMIRAGNAAVGPGDLAAGHVRGNQGLVDRPFDIARRRLDSDAQMIRGAGDAVAQEFAFTISDERGSFRGAAIDAEKVRHARSVSPVAPATSPRRKRTILCTIFG